MYRTMLCIFIIASFSYSAMAQMEGSNGETKFDVSGSFGQNKVDEAASDNSIEDSSASTGATAALEGEYTYDGLLAIGHGKYVAQDFGSAIDHYEKARIKEPARPDAYYFIGCAYKAQGQYQEAVSMLASAATVAGEDDVAMNARSLFVIATVWEMAKNYEKAKYAWIQYQVFAKLHPEGNPFVEIADAHIAAINAHTQRIAESKKVTERIAANTENPPTK